MAAKKNKGFLSRSMEEEDAVDENSTLEEQYMKIFPKIGRDFVHVEDLEELILNLLLLIAPEFLGLVRLGNNEAVQRAKLYKDLLEQNKTGNDVFKDLINLDED